MPRGKVERLGYSSQALANQRQLTLYTPPGYDPEGQRYPPLVLFDEDHYARDVPTLDHPRQPDRCRAHPPDPGGDCRQCRRQQPGP